MDREPESRHAVRAGGPTTTSITFKLISARPNRVVGPLPRGYRHVTPPGVAVNYRRS